MKKVAFKMKLKPGCEKEYKRRHDEIWPELEKLLKKSGIRDYTIFLDEETSILFAVQKIEKNKELKNLAEHKIMKKWWKHMAGIMDTNPDDSPVSVPLKKMYHLK
jgi:L-rhamnose mutarotase